MPYKYTIEDMQRIAEERGFKCLSKEYLGGRTILEFKCKENHIFPMTPFSFKQGQGCSICSSGFAERVCRRYFEIIYNKKFPKNKPKWLVNSRGNRMELDGCCKELNLAFEYQGEQHFIDKKERFKGYDLKQRKIDDKRKEELCKLHNVTLIIIDYTVKFKNMQKHIIDECKKNNIVLPEKIEFIDFRKLDVYSPERLKEQQELAKSHNGKCHSKAYLGTHVALKYECEVGHVFYMNPHHVKRGHWCQQCHLGKVAESRKFTIEDMQNIALEHGGWCLSPEYFQIDVKLWWQCGEEGHIWDARPHHVKRGHWCSRCSVIRRANAQRDTIENMRQLALERGGWCLSPEYFNAMTKLWWQCEKAHVFPMIPSDVKRNHWCPECGGTKRLTIEDMHLMARDRDGKCLSTKYINNKTKLKWQCKREHIFEMTPSDVKSNHWCPECYNLRRGKQNYKDFPHEHEFK